MALERKALIPEATPLERVILRDVEQKTGLTFRKIGGIDTRDQVIAATVLPVLAGWIAQLDDPPHRGGIYSRFHTPHAYAYLENIISWWMDEQDMLNSGILTQDLALLVRCSDAERIWKLCQMSSPKPFHYMLVSKLAICAAVEHAVKEALVHALNTESLRAGDLSYVAQVNDPRINAWFEGQIECKDHNIATVAKRLVSRLKPRPAGLEYAVSAPDRSQELFSGEEDLVHVSQLLKRIEKKFDLNIPVPIRTGAFLTSVEVGRWLTANISTSAGSFVSLWFRLEDIDTVEIVLLRETVKIITQPPEV